VADKSKTTIIVKKIKKNHPKKNNNIILGALAALVVAVAVFTFFNPKDEKTMLQNSLTQPTIEQPKSAA